MKTKKMITVMSLMMVLGTGTMFGKTTTDKRGENNRNGYTIEVNNGGRNGNVENGNVDNRGGNVDNRNGNVDNRGGKTYDMSKNNGGRSTNPGGRDMVRNDKGSKHTCDMPVNNHPVNPRPVENKVVTGVTTGIVVGTVITSLITSLMK